MTKKPMTKKPTVQQTTAMKTARWALSALLLGAAALSAEASRPSPNAPAPAQEGQPIDFMALAPSLQTKELNEEGFFAAVKSKGWDIPRYGSAMIELGDGRGATTWSECTAKTCRGWIALLSGGVEHPRLEKKAQLAAPSKMRLDGIRFYQPAFLDLDGDGERELVIHHHAEEPPRRALGSITHQYFTIYSPEDLSVLFSHEMWRGGGDSEPACRWTLRYAGDRLLLDSECNKSSCLDETSAPSPTCKPHKQQHETWRKASGAKRYTRVADRRR